MKRSEHVAKLRSQYKTRHSKTYLGSDPNMYCPIAGIYKIIKIVGSQSDALIYPIKAICCWKEEVSDWFLEEFEVTLKLNYLLEDRNGPKDDWFELNNDTDRIRLLLGCLMDYNVRILSADSKKVKWDFIHKNNNYNIWSDNGVSKPQYLINPYEPETDNSTEKPKIFVSDESMIEVFKERFPNHEIILVNEEDLLNSQYFEYLNEYYIHSEKFGKENAKTIPVPGIYRISTLFIEASDKDYDNRLRFLGSANYLKNSVDDIYDFDTSFSVVIRLNSLANISSSNPTKNEELLEKKSFRRREDGFASLCSKMCEYYFIKINSIDLIDRSYKVNWELIKVSEPIRCD